MDIAIAKIVSPHGVTGAVKVWPYSDFNKRYLQLPTAKVHVGKPGTPALPPSPRQMIVSRVSAYGRFWLIKFEQIGTREEAQNLRGLLIYISAEDRYPLSAGNYYYDQIIGLEVYDSGRRLGKVVEIRSTPAHDLYVIAGVGAGEVLLPAVKEFVQEINLKQRIMTVKIPEGLEDL